MSAKVGILTFATDILHRSSEWLQDPHPQLVVVLICPADIPKRMAPGGHRCKNRCYQQQAHRTNYASL